MINTMGWVKGFGLSLLRDISMAAFPSHLLSLCSGNPRKDVATTSPWMLEGTHASCCQLLCQVLLHSSSDSYIPHCLIMLRVQFLNIATFNAWSCHALAL